jgi:hypothetical protein
VGILLQRTLVGIGPKRRSLRRNRMSAFGYSDRRLSGAVCSAGSSQLA